MRLLLILLLLGCKHVDQTDPISEFTTHSIDIAINKFENSFKVEVDSLITFSDLPYNGVPGKCFVEGNHITLNKEFWLDASDITREALVFHELGHCMLRLGHTEYPSLMNGFIGYTASYYKDHYDESVVLMSNL